MKKPEWIVIANASRARVLEMRRGDGLQLVHSFSHPESRMKASELGDDRAGREIGGGHFGGAAYEPRTDAKRKEHERFARELAGFLEEAAAAGGVGSVSIFATSPFLGELKHVLGPAALRLVDGMHDVDLTAVGLAELPSRIQAHGMH